jgi:hypothetical protein
MQTVKYSQKLQDLRTLANKQSTNFNRLINECTVTVQKTGNVHSFAKPTTTQCGTTFELICALFLEKVYPGCIVHHITELSQELQTILGIRSKDVGIDLIMTWEDKVYPVQCKLRSPTWNPVLKRTCAVLLARELRTFFKACNNPMFSMPIVCTSADQCTAVNCIKYTRSDFEKVFTNTLQKTELKK